jgi:hypothetical protein
MYSWCEGLRFGTRVEDKGGDHCEIVHVKKKGLGEQQSQRKGREREEKKE